MLNIAVLVSGGGTNLQAIIDAIDAGKINGRITAVISSRQGAYALERAQKNGIPGIVVARKSFGSSEDFDHALLEALHQAKAELVVLAGFLSILGQAVISEYKNRILNVHPSLIPAFCGDGYYGLRVHEAVLKYGVRVTGATVHFVNNVVDGGAILLQKAVEVKQDDTPETLQKRVMTQAEWVILPRAVALCCDGKVSVENGRVMIKEL
jgi:phosphoribosylglycinamide formyltransferase-1